MSVRRFPSRAKERKFRARVDKNTSLTFIEKDSGIQCILKKDLTEYDVHIFPSEAPVTGDYLKKDIDPFEVTLADIQILEKEVFPIVIAIQEIFGEDKVPQLGKIRLAVGSNEIDYVTIDESEFDQYDFYPSIQGLVEFLKSNRKGVIGFCDREYQPEKGNLVFFTSIIKNPDKNIKMIELKIVSSLHQRGLYMQKYHQYYGLQLYVNIKADEIDDDFLELLKTINVDWELLFLRRDLSLQDWTEIECERNSINLKSYIRSRYDALGYFDVNSIIRLVIKNDLSFKIADRIADLLNRAKIHREGGLPKERGENLNKAEIAAAAQLACAYFGENKNTLVFDKDVAVKDIEKFVNELIKI